MRRRVLLAIVAQRSCIISFAQDVVYNKENNFCFWKGCFKEGARSGGTKRHPILPNDEEVVMKEQ